MEMRRAENMNAPNLWGWAIAAAAGLVAFGVLVLVGEFDLFPAAAMAGGLAGIVGLILGMPWGAESHGPVDPAARVPVPPPGPAVAPAPHVAPVAEAVTSAPAAVVSAPAPGAAGPARLTAARGGKADDLKEIEGIGPAMEKLVNSLGFYHFDQIASWSEADVAVVDAEMKTFKGRIARDKWVAQARIIVSEGLEAFRERAKTNNY
jgi:predicted flap endonuclease-1-like 5' DNA nuclease